MIVPLNIAIALEKCPFYRTGGHKCRMGSGLPRRAVRCCWAVTAITAGTTWAASLHLGMQRGWRVEERRWQSSVEVRQSIPCSLQGNFFKWGCEGGDGLVCSAQDREVSEVKWLQGRWGRILAVGSCEGLVCLWGQVVCSWRACAVVRGDGKRMVLDMAGMEAVLGVNARLEPFWVWGNREKHCEGRVVPLDLADFWKGETQKCFKMLILVIRLVTLLMVCLVQDL